MDPPAIQREEAFPGNVLVLIYLPAEGSLIQHLADGEDDAVGGKEEFRILQGNRAPAATGIRFAQGHFDQFQPFLCVKVTRGVGQKLKSHAFLPGFGNLFDSGRHFFFRPPVDDGDAPRAQADSSPGRINGGVPAADHHHPVACFDGTGLRILQEFQGGDDRGRIPAFQPHSAAQLGADPDKDGLITLPAEGFHGEILAHRCLETQVNPHAQDLFDLPV